MFCHWMRRCHGIHRSADACIGCRPLSPDEQGVRFLHHGSPTGGGIGDEDLIVLVPVIAVVQGKVVDDPEEVQRLEQLETGGIAPQVPSGSRSLCAGWQQTTFSRCTISCQCSDFSRPGLPDSPAAARARLVAVTASGSRAFLQTIQVFATPLLPKLKSSTFQSGITDHVDRFAADLLQRFFEGFPKRSQVVVKVVNSLRSSTRCSPGRHEKSCLATTKGSCSMFQPRSASILCRISCSTISSALHLCRLPAAGGPTSADILFVESISSRRGQGGSRVPGNQQPLKKLSMVLTRTNCNRAGSASVSAARSRRMTSGSSCCNAAARPGFDSCCSSVSARMTLVSFHPRPYW